MVYIGFYDILGVFSRFSYRKHQNAKKNRLPVSPLFKYLKCYMIVSMVTLNMGNTGYTWI